MASDDGQVGVGEILPRPYLTGESIEEAWTNGLPAMAERWVGRIFLDRDETLAAAIQELQTSGRALAALAGFELAVLDLSGKVFGFGAGDILGLTEIPQLPAGVVIDFGIPTCQLEKHCALLRLRGQRYIKVNLSSRMNLFAH
jgi:L-alanine-DL-glutamate epimerase-like enolase superfamily enzyme